MLTEQKGELRKTMMAQREAIAPEARKAAAKAVAEHGLPAGIMTGPAIVSSYWAIGAELDPGRLETAFVDGVRLAVLAFAIMAAYAAARWLWRHRRWK